MPSQKITRWHRVSSTGVSCWFAIAFLVACGDPGTTTTHFGAGGSSNASDASHEAPGGGSGGPSILDARTDAPFPEATPTGGDQSDASTEADAFAADVAADAPTSSDAAASDGAPTKVAHRVLTSASDRGILAIVDPDGQIAWQYDALSLGGEANDAWLLPTGNVVFAYKQGAREITQAKQTVWNYTAPPGSEVHSCQPLSNGNFLVGEAHDGGIGYLREVDATGKVVSTITIDAGSAIAPHGQFREVRRTPEGTYLVTYLQLDKAREYDATGKVLREFPCGSFVAIRLPDGNTLIACGDGHRVIEVNPSNAIVWEVTEKEIPGNQLGFVAGLQRLPNGNTIICNWPGHFAVDPHEPQAFELTRDKKLVWQIQNAPLGWVSNLEVLDPDAAIGGVILR